MALVFDEARYAALTSPGDREMFIFKWLSNLDAHLEDSATKESLKPTQERLELILLEIATIPLPVAAGGEQRSSWLGGTAAAGSRQTILLHVPKPTRIVRDLVAKCLARVYEVGDVHRMGETLYAIQTVMHAKRRAVERETRLAALTCAGVLFEALSSKAGFRLLSCFNDFLVLMLKFARSSDESVAVRVEATRALAKLFQAGKTATEAQAREAVKTLRANLVHRSPLLVLATVGALESLVFFTPFLGPEYAFDAEGFVTSGLVPLLSSSVLVVRRAVARLVAVIISHNITLVSAAAVAGQETVSAAVKTADPAARAIARTMAKQQVPRPASASASVSPTIRASIEVGAAATAAVHDSQQQSSGTARVSSDLLDVQPSPPLTQSPLAPALIRAGSSTTGGRSVSAPRVSSSAPESGLNSGQATLSRALLWLSQAFTRASASRELRAGLIDAYAALFDELGTSVVEAQYSVILGHILGVLASATQIPSSTAIDSRTRAPRAGLTHAIGTPSNLPNQASGQSEVVGLVGALDARAEADILALRNMCAWLLRVPLAEALLSESGKRIAAQCIWDRWLAGSLPVEVRAVVSGDGRTMAQTLMPWRTGANVQAPGSGSGEVAVLVALQEWRMLVEDLGESVRALDVFESDDCEDELWVVPLERWLADSNEAIRTNAASALSSLVRNDSARVSRVLSTLISRFQQFCAHCSAHSDASLDAMKRTVGYAYAIAGVIGNSSDLLSGVPLDLVEWVHSIAIRLLNAAYQRVEPEIVHDDNGVVDGADPAGIAIALGVASPVPVKSARRRVNSRAVPSGSNVALANMRMTAGWVLLSGLTALGTAFVAMRARTQWMSLWMAALPPPDSAAVGSHVGFVTGDMLWPLRAHHLQSRGMALSHLVCFMRTCDSECQLNEGDLRRVVASLKSTLMFVDNALDAPPPPSSQSVRRVSMSQAMGASFEIIDPARPMWQLPIQTSLLVSHMQVRARVVECLQTLTAQHSDLVAAMTLPTVRLIEQAIGSVDNLYEMLGTRMGAAAVTAVAHTRNNRDPAVLSPALSVSSVSTGAADRNGDLDTAGSNAGVVTCLRGFRSGPWGYEAETGMTTLLQDIVVGLESGSSLSSSLGLSSGDMDFGSCSMRAAEHDWLSALCPMPAAFRHSQPIQTYTTESPPAYMCLVDASVQLFGRLFPTLSENAQLTVLDGLVLQLNGLPFNSHRYAAVLTNILAALYAAIRGVNQARSKATMEVAPRVARAMVDVARAALVLPSAAHRLVAGEVIGCLAAVTRDATASYLPSLMDHLTSQAIRSRDRFARAGAAVALGSLYSRAGSIVALGTLRQVVVLLHSLASDKDPIVHSWAIGALAEAAMSAGYMFEPYARDTFQMTLKLFLSDSHAMPLHASALWVRGKEHMPPVTSTDCAGSHERVLPLRSATDLHAWARQTESNGGGAMALGAITAYGRDAAITHPNSTTHHGRSADEQRHAATVPDADFTFVCARADVDSFDARAALGHLVSSLLLVFGPELQVDDVTRDSVLTLLRELRRSLPSTGAPMERSVELSLVTDPDARWQTSAQFIFATQKQLLFFAPREPEFLPLLVKHTLRPIMRARRAAYYGHSGGIHAFHRVAVSALEGVLRLYGSRIVDFADGWALCDVVWETLVLYSAVTEQCRGDSVAELIADLQRLIHTTVSLACTHEYAQLELDGDSESGIPKTRAVVAALSAVFTKRATAVMPISIRRQESVVGNDVGAITDDDGARPFSSAAKQLAIAAIVAILDCVDRLRPQPNTKSHSVSWRSHPLTPLLADLVSVGYIAASAPATQSPILCCLGQHLLQRLIAQFKDVEDPALRGEGQSVLGIYQAQLSSAFMPVLSESSVAPQITQAAVLTATAFVVSGLVSGDRATLTRILRLLAPQPAFAGDVGVSTPQMQIVTKLTILYSWSTIFGYAVRRGPGVLRDALELHLSLLGRLWLDAIRDTAVIGMRPRDVYEELAFLRCNEQVDIGMGLSLGLESTYVGLVREPLAVWYRAYLPYFLDSVSKLLLLGPSSELALGAGYDELLTRLRGSETSGLAVLLLGFALQELSRLSVLSSMTRYAQAGASLSSDPFVATAAQLVGPLDVDGQTGSDTEAERISSLQRAGIRVYGPTQSASSVIGAQWLGDMNLVSSLLSTIRALLDLLLPDVTALFADTNSPGCSKSWLVEELWTSAVSNVVVPFNEGGAVSVDSQQRVNRSVRVGAVVKALDVALALLTLLGNTTLLDQWLFTAEDLDEECAKDDVPGLLGLSAFGRTVVRDIVGTWQAAQSLLSDEKEALTVVGSCLEILAVVISRRCESTPLVAFWLSLWRQSMLTSAAGHSKSAADTLASFVRRTTAFGAATVADSDDMLSGGDVLSNDIGLISSMVNLLLLQLLQLESDDNVVFAALGVVAHLLAAESQVLQVSNAVQACFASVLADKLATTSSSAQSQQLTLLLDVPLCLARASTPVPVFPALARAAIPALAKLVFIQLDSSSATGCVVLERALDALAAFATARYTDPAQSGLVMAAVLMLMLSMLPDELSRVLSPQETCLAEAILGLATKAPETFKAILLKLSATQPTAKRRLELAIRSRSSSVPATSAQAVDTTTSVERDIDGVPSSGRIALKSSFGV
ncbi:hypothetical protein GGH93_003497 [Coemansia aciculifera]|nr:hypothetical protein GGH93_003497 [Coemansia aciculifera]